MTIYFFDSSAAVKKYVTETGTPWVLSLFKQSAESVVYVAQITGVEVVSAISRRFRAGNLAQKAAQRSIARFKNDFQNRLRILRLTDNVVADAMQLSETHGLRGYDAVQLAVAIELGNKLISNNLSSIIFVSSDDNLNKAAQAERLAVDNPNKHL